jgi:hypothetical protein
LSLIVPALAALGLSGCAGLSKATSEPIQEINLFCAPAAMSFDNVPGPDGISVRIYAGNFRQPKPVAITSGTLEILLFDGAVTADELAKAAPLHVWSLPAQELGRHVQKTSVGISYTLALRWGKDKPTRNRVTVVARYLSPDGGKVHSAPTVVFAG